MSVNEQRSFKIDKSKTRGCMLRGTPGDLNVVEIKIEKQNAWNNRRFNLVGKENVYLDCHPGKLQYVYIAPDSGARGCGISKILTRLCMNEEGIHNVQNSNEAMKTILHVIHYGYPELQNVKNWVESECEKIFHWTMVAEDGNGNDRAGLYFKSSEASGFTKMFIVNTRDETYLTYPEDGPCCIDEVEQQYDGQGWAWKNNKHDKVRVYGAEWFFCFPKPKSNTPCCTIL